MMIKLKELAATIQREGLIGLIMVRLNGGRYELIAGERRLRGGTKKVSRKGAKTPRLLDLISGENLAGKG